MEKGTANIFSSSLKTGKKNDKKRDCLRKYKIITCN